MDTIKLSASALKLTTDVIKGDMQISNKCVKLADSFRAENVTAAMLETEKKGGSEGLREQVKAAIVAAFTDGERALLATDTKALSDSDKGTKKTLQQRAGSYLDKVRSHIAKAEKEEEGGDAQASKTAIQRIHADLDKAIAKLQKLENPAFDVAEAIKRANSIKGMMPAV